MKNNLNFISKFVKISYRGLMFVTGDLIALK